METIMSSKHFSEEVLIDYVLGEAPEDRQHEICKHLEKCTKCREINDNWIEVFNQQTNAQPPADLKDKIWKEAMTKRSPRKKQRTFVFGLSSAAAVFLLLFGLLMNNHSNFYSYQVAHNDDIVTANIQSNPQTEQLSVIPVADFNDIKGRLWINGMSQELLLEVDGLADITDKDYQLWIIYDNDEIKGELLSTVNGTSRILIKGNDVPQFKIIKASIEPLGGSQEPTGPETFVVPLKK